MAQFYEMPAVSPTMEVGTLVKWKVAEGKPFESGTVLAEVGTDKANMDAEIFDTGVLIKHLLAEGDEAPAGFPIAIWGKKADEDIAGLLAEYEKRKSAKAAAPAAKSDNAPPPAETSAPAAGETEAPGKPRNEDPPTQQEAPAKAPPEAAPAPAGTTKIRREWAGKAIHADHYDPPGDLRFGLGKAPSGRVAASPLARAMAADLGVRLEGLKGTGPGGRIVAADVEKAKSQPQQAPAQQAVTGRQAETVRNTPMRKTIAKRLLESHQQIPTFFLTVTLDMTGFVQLRETLKAKLPDAKISYNDMLIAAVARALREHPDVNASWGPDAITRHGRVDIGVAVALPQGLITPVVRNADQKTFGQIATEVRALAGRAKEQKLAPEEYTGGTFTISNLGMMEIDHFTAIVNPPEAAILAVGAIQQLPVVGPDGQLTVGHRMRVTMTCDHRVIDGAVGAAFLQTVRKYVESPILLLA